MYIAHSKLAGHSVEDSVDSTVIDQATFQCSWENWTDVFCLAIALFVGVLEKKRVFWFLAITILQTLKTAITIQLIGKLPLQF